MTDAEREKILKDLFQIVLTVYPMTTGEPTGKQADMIKRIAKYIEQREGAAK